MSDSLVCPVCRAANHQPPACRRCRADLSLLWQVREQAARELTKALEQIRGGDLSDILPMLAARRWPLSQTAALEALPRLAEGRGLTEDELATLLSAVAGLESSPIHAERSNASALAPARRCNNLAARKPLGITAVAPPSSADTPATCPCQSVSPRPTHRVTPACPSNVNGTTRLSSMSTSLVGCRELPPPMR